MSVPLSIIMKSAAILKEDEMASSAAIAWEFLLQSNKEIVATAGNTLPRCVLLLGVCWTWVVLIVYAASLFQR